MNNSLCQINPTTIFKPFNMPKNSKPFSHRKPRIWRKIIFQAPDALTDWVAETLFTITGNGVQTGDGDTPGTQILIGYINADANEKTTEEQIHDLLKQLYSPAADKNQTYFEVTNLEEEDWGATWKKQFKPVHISNRLIICPSWEKTAPNKNQTVVSIDPGMAFGTGLHATTQLALQCIESRFHGPQPPPATVLDIGTGTGILAITSALFGADSVMATDIDPDAVHAARENTERNGMSEVVKIWQQDISELDGPFDLVTANITHDVLLGMATDLTKLTKISGHLVLTGLLAGPQTESITTAFTNYGFSAPDIFFKDEWTALLFEKIESK